MKDRSLAGSAILVTRPEHQATELVAAIESAGGEAVLFPVLKIERRPLAEVDADADSLPLADIVVFTSANAVAHGLRPHAGSTRIAAIGPATAQAIESAGEQVAIRPVGGFDSEALLRAPELQAVAGQNIRIVRGDGGRELLAGTLRSRGARVDYLAVYRRLPATPSRAALERLERRWRNGDIRAVVVMSVDSFHNLRALLPQELHELLGRTPLVTPSGRVIQTIAEHIPGSPAFLATGPQAADMLRALAAAIASGNPT